MQRTITGLRIRERRRELGIRQKDLAARVGVSAPYLNLIERNKRAIGGALLSAIGRELSLRLEQLDGSSERRLREELLQAAPGESGSRNVESVDEFIARFPDWARAAAAAHDRAREAEAAAEAMADRLAHDPALASAVHDMLTEIAALRSTAEILAETGEMEAGQRRRFERNVFEQSSRLARTGGALAAYFDETTEARRRRTPVSDAEELLAKLDVQTGIDALAAEDMEILQKRGLDLEIALAAALDDRPDLPPEAGRAERLAALAGMHADRRAVDRLAALIPGGAEPGVAAAMAAELRQRFIDAMLAPYVRFSVVGLHTDWNVAAMTRAWDGDAGLVMRRMACIGIPSLHMEVDASGRVLARRGALELTPPGRRIDCPVWPVHRTAGGGPERVSAASVRFPDGTFALAVTAGRRGGMAADMLLFDEREAFILDQGPVDRRGALNVGPDCRICAHPECGQRREPPVMAAANGETF